MPLTLNFMSEIFYLLNLEKCQKKKDIHLDIQANTYAKMSDSWDESYS